MEFGIKMNNKLKKYIVLAASIAIFFIVFAVFLETSKHVIDRDLQKVLDWPIFGVSFIAAFIFYNLFTYKDFYKDIRVNHLFWRYWLIGIVVYFIVILIIANQPKEATLSLVGFLAAALIGWFGYYKYHYDMIVTDPSFCKRKARDIRHDSYSYICRLLNYREHARVLRSETSLRKGNKEEALDLAIEAYENSNAYVDGYTIVRLKK